MATEYYLLTCLGRDGLAVSVATTGVITLGAHGMRAGHPVRMTATTFPGGAAANTTYYVSATNLETGSFKISATDGGTPLTFTSTGSGVKLVGAYWATLPATDPGGGANYKARYGSAGSERVFANIYDLRIYLYDNRDYSKNICVEIQGAWTDVSAHYLTSRGGWLWSGYFSLEITTRIRGVRNQESFHYGVPGGGWAWISPVNYFQGFSSSASRVIIDGVEAGQSYNNDAALAFSMSGSLNQVVNCIANGSPTGVAFRDGGKGNLFANNIAIGWPVGFEIANANGNGSVIAHCLAVQCGTGFKTGGSTGLTDCVNNLSVSNTTNWGTIGGGFYANNAGATGDVIWTSVGQSNITGVTTAVFNNYSANDFSLSASATLLIDGGYDYFGMLPDYAIDDAVRPNYEAATYPDNYRDVGPFEYDHGDGLVPIAATLTIAANVNLSGAEIHIYDANNTPAGTFGTELSGTESNVSATYTYSAASLLNNTIYIQVMQSGYEELLASHTVTNISETLTITLKSDVNA